MDNFWGIDENQLEQEEKIQEEERKKFTEVSAGIYPIQIEKAFLSKSDGGATALELEVNEVLENGSDGRKMFFQFWIKSGDEKGNKATYTDKNGNERPLPAWNQVNHLLKVSGLKLKDLKPKDATIEKGDKTIQVKALEELSGKKMKVVIQQYENEWDNNISIRYEARDFLNLDGTNIHGEIDAEEKWQKTLDKTPIRKLKNKAKLKTQDSEETKNAVDSW